MVSEAQHDRWRNDIAANIEKAMDAVKPENLSDAEKQLRRHVALETNKVIAQVMIGERLGQLSRAINLNDETIEGLHGEVKGAESIIERLVKIVNDAEDDLPRGMNALAGEAGSWVETRHSLKVDQKAAGIEQPGPSTPPMPSTDPEEGSESQ